MNHVTTDSILPAFHLRILLLAPAIAIVVGCSHAPVSGGVQQSETDAGAVRSPASPAPITPRTLPGAAAGAPLDLRVGDSVQGQLEANDQVLADQSLGDDYALMLTEGQPITVVVRAGVSTDTDGGLLDPQVVLLFNDREVASDDDSARQGTAGNSRIVFSPPVSGLYVLRVTTSGGGAHHGAYALQVYPGGLLRQL